MVALILAAGEQTRWKAAYPKQLIRYQGRTLVERIARQMDKIGRETFLVTHDEQIAAAVPDVPVFNPPARRYTSETLLSTRALWDDDVLMLYGDAIYSARAIAAVHTMPEICAGTFAELLAARFTPQTDYGRIVKTLQAVISMAELGVVKGKMFDFYRAWAGLPLKTSVRLFGDDYRLIADGFTRDFDQVSFLQTFRRELAAGLREPLPERGKHGARQHAHAVKP